MAKKQQKGPESATACKRGSLSEPMNTVRLPRHFDNGIMMQGAVFSAGGPPPEGAGNLVPGGSMTAK